MCRGYLSIRAGQSRQGLDGAQVVLQFGHEFLLPGQAGHGLGQLDLQLSTAHCKTQQGCHPGPKPTPNCAQGTPKGSNPHLEQQSQPRAATLLSPHVWKQQEAPQQQFLLSTRGPALLGDAPGWAQSPGRSRATSQCQRQWQQCLHWHSCFKGISQEFWEPQG